MTRAEEFKIFQFFMENKDLVQKIPSTKLIALIKDKLSMKVPSIEVVCALRRDAGINVEGYHGAHGVPLKSVVASFGEEFEKLRSQLREANKKNEDLQNRVCLLENFVKEFQE